MIALARSHPARPQRRRRPPGLTESRRAAAVAAGAVEITWRDAAHRSHAETVRLREHPELVEPEQGTLL